MRRRAGARRTPAVPGSTAAGAGCESPRPSVSRRPVSREYAVPRNGLPARLGAKPPAGLLAALLLACAALFAVLSPTPALAQSNTEPLWSTTMTVGEGSGGSRGFYNFGTDLFGSLDDDDFMEGGNDTNVVQVNSGGVVRFTLSRDLSDRDSYILEFAGEELPLDEATNVNTSGGRLNLQWHANWVDSNAPSLDGSNYTTTLPNGARVPVCLRTAAQVCPAGASDDTTLSALELADSDGSAVALSPVFASGTSTYTASVVNAVGRVTVTPTTTDANATVDFLDGSDGARTDADTGTDGFQVDLDVGENVIGVKVTAEDTSNTQTYQVTVTRAEPPSGTTPPLVHHHDGRGRDRLRQGIPQLRN